MLNSTYQSQWNGGTIGISFYFPIHSFYIGRGYDLDIYTYSAKVNWNLQKNFQKPVNFRHTALGFKRYVTLQAAYKFSERFDIGVSIGKYYGVTSYGKDKVYLINGDIKNSRFNGTEFRQFTGLLHLKYEW
ncbi:hypothetical protein HZP25_15715 [Elizabethkingia anophelis]|nr:hypothetical protein [Elizabethkingia anophelis]